MTTNFSDIDFNEKYHTYTHRPTGQRLPSVTRVTGSLKPLFDAPAVAARVAAREGRTPADVLADWDAARIAGQELGKRVHAHIESVLRGAEPQADRLLETPEIRAFNLLWRDLQPGVEVRKVEWIVGDLDLGVAGTLDTILYNPDTQSNHIWDWKTGKKFEGSNRWETMLPPFATHDNCELVNYSLQTSLYRLIVERNTEMRLGDSYLVYLSPLGSFQIHKAIDFRPQLLKWLTEADRG